MPFLFPHHRHHHHHHRLGLFIKVPKKKRKKNGANHSVAISKHCPHTSRSSTVFLLFFRSFFLSFFLVLSSEFPKLGRSRRCRILKKYFFFEWFSRQDETGSLRGVFFGGGDFFIFILFFYFPVQSDEIAVWSAISKHCSSQVGPQPVGRCSKRFSEILSFSIIFFFQNDFCFDETLTNKTIVKKKKKDGKSTAKDQYWTGEIGVC